MATGAAVLLSASGEFASGDKGDSRGGKIAGTYLVVLNDRLFVRRRDIAIHGDGGRPGRNKAQRNESRKCRGLDARKRLETHEQLLLEILCALRIVARAEQINLGYQHIVRRKTWARISHFL